MQQVTWTDPKGRRFEMLLPDEAKVTEAGTGIAAGPPSLAKLNLPPATEVRLHNQLHDRGLLTAKDVRQRMEEVSWAIAAALQLDVQAIEALYQE